MNHKGLNVLNILNTLIAGKFISVKLISIKEVITINISSIFHASHKYEPLSCINPKAIHFKIHSIAKKIEKKKSNPIDIYTLMSSLDSLSK
jgi:hypothetical protein